MPTGTERILDLIESQFGAAGILAITLAFLGVYCWHLYWTNKRATEKANQLEQDAKTAKEEIQELRAALGMSRIANLRTRGGEQDTAAISGKKLNVLLAEDEEAVRYVITAQLQRALPGLAIFGAASGAEALEQSMKRSIDLILTDLRMPGMSGESLLQQFEQIHGARPTVVISGYTEAMANLAASTPYLGREDVVFISKPFTAAELVDAIGEALSKAKSGTVAPAAK